MNFKEALLNTLNNLPVQHELWSQNDYLLFDGMKFLFYKDEVCSNTFTQERSYPNDGWKFYEGSNKPILPTYPDLLVVRFEALAKGHVNDSELICCAKDAYTTMLVDCQSIREYATQEGVAKTSYRFATDKFLSRYKSFGGIVSLSSLNSLFWVVPKKF